MGVSGLAQLHCALNIVVSVSVSPGRRLLWPLLVYAQAHKVQIPLMLAHTFVHGQQAQEAAHMPSAQPGPAAAKLIPKDLAQGEVLQFLQVPDRL